MRLDRETQLVGEKVELRRHVRENYPLYADWYGDEEIWRLTSWADAPLRPAAVERLFDEREASPADRSFAVHRRGERKPIGVISLTNVNRTNGKANLSVILGSPEDRDRGHGAEAINLILQYGFEELELQRISLSVFEYNTQAISVYERLGFREEGRVRQAIKRDGALYDAILMGIPKYRWRSPRQDSQRR